MQSSQMEKKKRRKEKEKSRTSADEPSNLRAETFSTCGFNPKQISKNMEVCDLTIAKN